MVGSGGRTPFVGHFRGGWAGGAAWVAWSGRIAASASVSDGWEAAERARDVLRDAPFAAGMPPAALLAAATAALARVEGPWLARGDLDVLLLAGDGERTRAAGAGLGAIFARVDGAWRSVVAPEHPLLGERGVLPTKTWELPPGADVWVAVPAGLPFPAADPAAACGVHT
jgi:hypothetical protein